MARRMVVRCDECGRDADMVYLSTGYSGSALGPFSDTHRPGYLPSFGPRPPDNWFQRFGGLNGTADLCSLACVQAWDEKRPKEGALA